MNLTAGDASSISQGLFNPRHVNSDACSLPVINCRSYLAFIGVILGVVKESHSVNGSALKRTLAAGISLKEIVFVKLLSGLEQRARTQGLAPELAAAGICRLFDL